MCISVFICISHFLRLKKFLIGYFCDLKLIMEKLPDIHVRYYASCFDIQDCPHVSRTLEEFYTVRCQVTDMKNLYVSFLDPHLHVYSYQISQFQYALHLTLKILKGTEEENYKSYYKFHTHSVIVSYLFSFFFKNQLF